MQPEILHIEKHDLATVLQLQKDCYISEAEIYNDFNIPPLHQDLKSLEKEAENTIILKGVIDGEIIGSIRGYASNGTCYIGKLFVKKEFQNKKIGQLLLNSIETVFNESKRFELFTGNMSLKNLHLYNKLGYRQFKQQVINNNLTIIYLEKKK